MPRSSRLTDEQRERLRVIAVTRKNLPSNKQLAYEMGVSERTIEFYLSRFLRENAVSDSQEDEKIAS